MSCLYLPELILGQRLGLPNKGFVLGLEKEGENHVEGRGCTADRLGVGHGLASSLCRWSSSVFPDPSCPCPQIG